jgi:hypothetical protein
MFVLAAAVAMQLLGAASAYAHDLLLSAQGVCVNGSVGITFTVASNSPDHIEGTHNNIIVSFNGTPVGTYQFILANHNSVTDTRPVAGGAGDTVAVSALADGPWGDGAPGGDSAAVSVTLPSDCNPSFPGVGRFTGGGKSIDTGTGLKVTKGFTIHCDLLLSNNLEINWPGSGNRTNQFHMTQHTAARCTDDPAIDQRPPAAPVDRIDGVGTGRFNGVAGATVEFILIDAGEPGTADQIGFIVRDANGVVVLNLPLQNIVGGNVQAHYDQPHKQ